MSGNHNKGTLFPELIQESQGKGRTFRGISASTYFIKQYKRATVNLL